MGPQALPLLPPSKRSKRVAFLTLTSRALRGPHLRRAPGGRLTHGNLGARSIAIAGRVFSWPVVGNG